MSDRYPFDRPTAADLIRALADILGPQSADAALGVAVRDAVSPTAPLDQLTPAQLLEVARALIRQRGLTAIIGRSFEIRLHSFLDLQSAVSDAGPLPSVDPHAEQARIRELAALDLGADIDEFELQDLVDQAAAALDLPIAAISIVLDSAQYFIASRGLGGWIGGAAGTPGEWAFCRNTIDTREPFVVEDASTHPLVRQNPLVQIDGIRCYLGIPLITRNDEVIGTLCVLGVEQRRFAASDVERLRELASAVLLRIEARRA